MRHTRAAPRIAAFVLVLFAQGCDGGEGEDPDSAVVRDASVDAPTDAAPSDAGMPADAAPSDAGMPADAAPEDAGLPTDAGCATDLACDDGRFCNGVERCDPSGACIAGTPPAIDDGLDCTVDECDEGAGTVVHRPDDAACDDADACTTDTCTAGVGCTHGFTCACTDDAECSDGNPCTDDACDTTGACVYTNNAVACDDGMYCNGTDTCSGGACAVHAGDPCLSGPECADTCDEASDGCAVPAGTPCTDEGNPCTDDRCDGAGACAHPNNTAACDDGMYCNGADTCSGGACSVHAGDPCLGGPECADTCDEASDGCAVPAGTPCTDEGNPCTDDRCDGAGACAHPNNTAACDDGMYCNGADTCSGGACSVHAGDPCLSGPECADTCNESADDCYAAAGSACTDPAPDDCQLAGCDGAGACVPTFAPAAPGSSCRDGTFCNGADTCDAAGACSVHAGDPCAPDVCAETTGSCLTRIRFVHVAGGSRHTCGVTGNGVAYCWGRDSDGQLGNGSVLGDQARPYPVDTSTISGARTFVGLAAGSLHTCGVTTDGAIYCWGNDSNGQLGNGSVGATTSPSRVSAPAGTVFTQVAAGEAHSCGLTAAGVAYCWGFGAYGQLGNGGSPVVSEAPTAVTTSGIPGARAFTQLVAGYVHTCGLTTEGLAYCWGRDAVGQLGNGGAGVDVTLPAAVDMSTVPAGERFVQLAAGGETTCALTGTRVAYCWGSDSFGQLGDIALGDQQSPSQVDTSMLAGDPRFVRLAAGALHVCAITAEGVAYCWGRDFNGQLGDGGGAVDVGHPVPVEMSSVAGTEPFVHVGCGWYHTCGITAAGEAYCWGLGDNGQLGTASGTPSEVPGAVDTQGLGGTPAFVDIQAGAAHACGVTDAGQVFCWGSDLNGRLGNGTGVGSTSSPSPVDSSVIAGSRAFREVTVGTGHSCGLTAQGRAYCWGWDNNGQLGNGGAALDTQVPSAVDTTAMAGSRAFVQLSAGRGHTCGLAADGRAYCWGHDISGQLGDGGAYASVSVPSPVDTSPITGSTAFVQLTAGTDHTCGITAAGIAYCWGWDNFGQLGNGAAVASTGSPSAVSTGSIFVRVSAGSYHTCGIASGGVAACWGSDANGELGNGASPSSQVPSAVDTSTVSGPTTFRLLAPGRGLTAHSCGVTGGGAAYCWGSDASGQLGDGGGSVSTTSPAAVSVATIPVGVFSRLSAGDSFTCGVDGGGAGYCWGRDESGRLGDGGASTDRQSPSPIDTSAL